MNTVLSPSSAFPTLSKTYVSFGPLFSSFAVPSSSSSHIELPRKRGSQNTGLRCNCSIWPGGPGSGDSDSSNRSILDAFFLGKAVAEALNERIESTVGEILSTVGRLQAEQQKQVQDFQVWTDDGERGRVGKNNRNSLGGKEVEQEGEEVLERAKKSKENAAREAMEAQGFISKSAVETKVTDSTTSKTSNSATGPVTSVQSTDASETDSEPAKEEEPTSSTSDE
ncbi:hypothetical protein JHK87_006625 [Glycine soja]|nr:hypothetical protein JHK87_006625 [Glycine soja]